MSGRAEGLQQGTVDGGEGASSPHSSYRRKYGMAPGVDLAAALSSLAAPPPDPDRDNTDDSGMGADLDADGGVEKAALSDDEEDEDDEEEEEEKEEEPKTRRTSSAGNERQRRPSYTCYHGAPLPRGAAQRMARRARPRPRRNLDMLQLAAGATVMLAPLTPELLR